MPVVSRSRHVLVTRPAGVGRDLARKLKRRGYAALLLPGSSLHAWPDPNAARSALDVALAGDVVVFTSPAAVRFAARLVPLRAVDQLCWVAIGAGTARALHRRGVNEVVFPMRPDSEGALALDALHGVQGRRVALIGAPGGRGLLAETLRKRGAQLVLAHVYVRTAPRWDARHLAPLRAVRGPLATLLTSTETLERLRTVLPVPLWRRLCGGTAVCASARLEDAAKDAGFQRCVRAASALDQDLIAALQQAF